MLITIKEHCCTTLNFKKKSNTSVVVYKRERREVFNIEGECSHSMNKLYLSLKKSQKLAIFDSKKNTKQLTHRIIHTYY
jgi:hypothetical protein